MSLPTKRRTPTSDAPTSMTRLNQYDVSEYSEDESVSDEVDVREFQSDRPYYTVSQRTQKHVSVAKKAMWNYLERHHLGYMEVGKLKMKTPTRKKLKRELGFINRKLVQKPTHPAIV